MDVRKNLVAVINTLGMIEVKGRENLNHLLGCIMALEQTVKELDNPEVPEITLEPVTEGDENEDHTSD